MSTTHDRYQQWTERARDIVGCTDENCTPESHIRSIRYLLLEAYDNGLLDGLREAEDRRTGAGR